MELVQCLVVVWMSSAQLVLTSPLVTITPSLHTSSYRKQAGGGTCKMCPAGEYPKSCMECESCPAGYYTAEWNREDFCHPCHVDCRPAFHLKVVQNCTSTSNMKCVCEEGFQCSHPVPYSTNCRFCAKTTTEAAVVTSDKDKHTLSSASSAQSTTSSKPCQFPKCGPQSVRPTGNGTNLKGDKTSSQLAAILCPVVAVGCLALVILFFVHGLGDETCFKQAIAKLYSEGGREAAHKPKESTHRFTRDSFSAKQQPSGLSAANLGPIHVHNPATVIFSLLSQFTGQVGPTIECGKTAERVISEEDDERDCPVFHPTSSPGVHLSEEERSGDTGSVFFPSQEQGKDCHVSKEEML